jgi:hypothetical protein
MRDSTTMDAIQGIYVFQYRDGKLLPRNDQDFENVAGAFCVNSRAEGELAAAELVVFPNPASTQLNLRADVISGTTEASVELIDLQGRVVRRRSVNLAQTSTIDIADLTDGLYILNVRSAGGSYTAKVIKR